MGTGIVPVLTECNLTWKISKSSLECRSVGTQNKIDIQDDVKTAPRCSGGVISTNVPLIPASQKGLIITAFGLLSQS